MKRIVTILTVLSGLILGCFNTTLYGQSENTETRVIEPFKELYVNGYFDVKLVKGDKPSINLVFNGVEKDKVITYVKKDELVIKHKVPFAKGYKVTVVVTYSNIKRIDGNFNAIIRFDDNAIETDKLKVVAGTNAEIIGTIKTLDLKVSSGEGASVRLKGESKYQDVSAFTGGVVNGFLLNTEVTKASASTGGKIHVKATGKIEASVTTGGHLNFIGNPKIKDISKILGGSYNELNESELNLGK